MQNVQAAAKSASLLFVRCAAAKPTDHNKKTKTLPLTYTYTTTTTTTGKI